MKKLFKTISVITLLCWNVQNSQACFQEKEEMKQNVAKPLPDLKEKEKEMTMLGLNHYFGEKELINSESIKMHDKHYRWHLSKDYHNSLKENSDLHAEILSHLCVLDEAILKWPSQERNKLGGFKFQLCGGKVYIEPFLTPDTTSHLF